MAFQGNLPGLEHKDNAIKELKRDPRLGFSVEDASLSVPVESAVHEVRWRCDYEHRA